MSELKMEWRGRDINEYSKEELIEIIRYLNKMLEAERNQKIDWSGLNLQGG